MPNTLDDQTRKMIQAVMMGDAGRGTVLHREFVDLAKRNGYTGHRGGYVKNDNTGVTVAHRWTQFAERVWTSAVPFQTAADFAQVAFHKVWDALTEAAKTNRYGEAAQSAAGRGEFDRARAFAQEADALALMTDEAEVTGDRMHMVITPSGSAKIAAHVARTGQPDDGTEALRQVALDAIGRTWAGHATESLELFQRGDYLGARRAAEAQIDRQRAELAARAEEVAAELALKEAEKAATEAALEVAGQTMIAEALATLADQMTADGFETAAYNMIQAARRHLGIDVTALDRGRPVS